MTAVPDLVLTDYEVSDALALSRENLVVMVFARTQSPYYKHAVGIATGAFRYSEVAAEKSVIHTVVFSKEAEQAARAIALLRYVEGWSTLQLFIAGRLHTGPVYLLRQVIECYQLAAHCADHRGYCLRISDVPFKREYDAPLSMSFQIVVAASPVEKNEPAVPPKPIRFVVPCQLLPDRHFIEKGISASWVDQMQAQSIKTGVDWCPFFDLREFRQFE